MQTPDFSDESMRLLLQSAQEKSVLDSEDDESLMRMVKAIRSGKPGIVIIGSLDEGMEYFLANQVRLDGISVMGKVIETIARKLTGR